MRLEIKHKGLRLFHETGSTKGIRADHAKKLARILARMVLIDDHAEMDVPGFGYHRLHGDRADTWSVGVNGNWRVTFVPKVDEKGEKYLDVVNYEDYH